MTHVAAYVPIALSFLMLIVYLIYHPSSVDCAEVEEKGLRLLRSWLSPKQAQQWEALNEFEVVGSHTDTRYRIRRGRMMTVALWCFGPKGALPIGDVLLAQKIALETMERETLKTANRTFVPLTDARSH
jgi:hypothetical protein